MIPENWNMALAGGVLIGLSASWLLLANGRIAGISGMMARLLDIKNFTSWPAMFLGGLVLGALLYEQVWAASPSPAGPAAPAAMLIGGLLAGFGTRLGRGCTSGHGVCGLGRLSPRSLVAVLTFMATAIVTVWLVRHAWPAAGGWFQ